MVTRRIHGNGPRPCQIMLLGERPGIVEQRRGRPFVGPAGEMLDQYLFHNAGIDRSNVFVSNVCRTYADHPPTVEELARDRQDLMGELWEVQPKFIGLLGQYAVRSFLPPDIDLHWSHGLRFDVPFSLGRGKIVTRQLMPVLHPAAGLHQAKLQGKTAYNFERFGLMIQGKLPPAPTDTVKADYWERTRTTRTPQDCAVDTEGTVERPWCLSLSTKPGEGCVQRRRWAEVRLDATTILHHCLHDLPVLKAMGITVPKFTDTMIMAHLLQTEPLGLKDLARRHCGMVMSEYNDIIRDARREVRLMFIAKVMEWASNKELECQNSHSTSEPNESPRTRSKKCLRTSGRVGKKLSMTA